MRTRTQTTKSNDKHQKLTPLSFCVREEKKLKTRDKISQELKRELTKIGYSEKAIQEISKWVPLD